jgi:hypothetical protein
MSDICVYSIRTYEKQILHNYYCQIVTHEVCDVLLSHYFQNVNLSNYGLSHVLKSVTP